MESSASSQSLGSSSGPTKRRDRELYPAPLMIPPLAIHRHSIILLHGLGSNAERFGLEFIKAVNSSGRTLQEIFPGLKFIFPTAKKRRATRFKRMLVNQWFDKYSFIDPSERQDLQYEGLMESGRFIHKLIQAEVDLVGPRNVVIGGLSQGCAMALHVLLSYPYFSPFLTENAECLGGFVGMSGWLPFEADIGEAAFGVALSSSFLENGLEDVFEPLGAEEAQEDQDEEDPQIIACNFVRDVADLQPLARADKNEKLWNHSPVFLGHGTADDKVDIKLGKIAEELLRKLEIDVSWRSYEDFGHWYKVPDEIDDIVDFLKDKVGFEATQNSN